MRRKLTILLIVSVLASLQAQELRKQGKYWIGTIQKSFKLAEGSLIMEDINGDILIKTWDKNEVSITETKRMDIFTEREAKAAMEASESAYSIAGSVITIEGEHFNRRWIESKFEISLPARFDCNLATEGGDISVEGLTGSVKARSGGGDLMFMRIDGEIQASTGGGDIIIESSKKGVRASTGGGDVEVTDCEGAVEISTGGGDVTLENVMDTEISTGGGDILIRQSRGSNKVSTGGGDITIADAQGDVEVRTGGGDIDIRNVNGDFMAETGGGSIDVRTVFGSLEVNTGGGDIDLEDIQGGIEVSTGGGDIEAEITLTDFTKRHEVTISTGGGEIILTIPEKLPATIQAEIRISKRSWEDYEISSDFALKRTSDDSNPRYRILRAEGDINGGGDLIRLTSGGGNIVIRAGK